MREILAQRPDALTEKLSIEKVLEPSEKTLEFAGALKLLEPYGEANPKPLFALAAASVYNVQYMGSDGQHVRFTAVCGVPPGTGVRPAAEQRPAAGRGRRAGHQRVQRSPQAAADRQRYQEEPFR